MWGCEYVRIIETKKSMLRCGRDFFEGVLRNKPKMEDFSGTRLKRRRARMGAGITNRPCTTQFAFEWPELKI
jgi:hypothetical protein